MVGGVALEPGVTSRTANLDPYAPLIGTVPDREVAELAGCHLSAVYRHRKRRAIPAAGAIDPQLVHLLGTCSDSDLAERAGVPWHVVQYARSIRGIPPYHQPSNKPTPAKTVVQFHNRVAHDPRPTTTWPARKWVPPEDESGWVDYAPRWRMKW